MDVPDGENSTLEVRWKTLSITTLVALIPIGIGLHSSYDNYHTNHVIRTVTPILSRHTIDVEGRIKSAQTTANETQRKVDYLSNQVASLQVSAAIAAVAALQAELDRHDRSPESSASWDRERDRLKRAIEQSKEYRQCLIERQANCNLLRGW